MSYPSITKIMRDLQIDPATADESCLQKPLLLAFQTNLADGMGYLAETARECLSSGKRLIKPEDPNSTVGKQLIRLLGTDVARDICEHHFGVAFGLYNCCGVIAAPTKDRLNISIREQIMLQNGVLASADC